MTSNSTKQKVEIITHDEILRSARILTDAFKNSPINKYLFSSKKQILQFYIVMLRYCVDYGLALRTEHYESIALRICPGDSFNNYWRFFRTGIIRFFLKLPLRSKFRFLQLNHVLSSQRKEIMDGKKHWYCWVLGTQSGFQGKGFGSELMHYTFNLAKEEGLNLYLQTDTESAKLCHQKKGYVVKKERNINQLKIVFMTKSIQPEE